MPKFFMLFSLMLIVASCSRNPDRVEMRMKHHAIVEQFTRNDLTRSAMFEEAGRSMEPNIQWALRKTNDIVSWRQDYMKKKTADNLLKYTDSVLTYYKRYKIDDKEMENAMKHGRQRVLSDPDSINVLNLLHYTQYGETILLNYMREFLSPYCGWSKSYATSVKDSAVALGDTVTVILTTYVFPPDDCKFDSLFCTNVLTKSTVRAKITRVREFYILQYVPQERGTYELHGTILSQRNGFEQIMHAKDEFVVE